jgi:SAM-dependent methyltransferase
MGMVPTKSMSSLLTIERAALDRVTPSLVGLDVIHLQCHLAFDSVSMTRMGARVTAVDFSAESLRKAKAIATTCNVDVDFVEANSMRLPGSLANRFDIAYATLGIFGWIYDVGAWMRSATSCLRPGGRLLIVDFHPVMNLFQSVDPVGLWGTYHFSGPQVDHVAGSYASPTEEVRKPRKAKFSYNVGEIVSSACAAGLLVDYLGEHEDSGYSQISRVQSRDDCGLWRCRLDGVDLPVLFTLIATKPVGR